MVLLFCLPSHLGSTLKEKNLLPLEQILSFESRPYFERVEPLNCSGKQTGNHKSCFPLRKQWKKNGGTHKP